MDDNNFSIEIVVMLKSAVEEMKKNAEDVKENLEIAMAALYEIAYPGYFSPPPADEVAKEAINKIEKKIKNE